jgi:hypothetical protein
MSTLQSYMADVEAITLRDVAGEGSQVEIQLRCRRGWASPRRWWGSWCLSSGDSRPVRRAGTLRIRAATQFRGRPGAGRSADSKRSRRLGCGRWGHPERS